MEATSERERLEREIYQLTVIIQSNADALKSATTRASDRAALQRQIRIRSVERDRLRALLANIPR
jgi:hypothetical protein